MSSSCCKGVTLIEMIVVVTIIAVFAVVALPSFTSSEKYQLEAAAQQFADAIRFARSEAIRTGNAYGVYIRDDLQKISVYRVDTGTNPWTPIYDVYHPVTKQIYTIDLNNDSASSVDSIVESFTYQGGSCTNERYTNFNNNGVAYCSDPNNVLMNQGALTFNLNSHFREITLNGLNGQVSVK